MTTRINGDIEHCFDLSGLISLVSETDIYSKKNNMSEKDFLLMDCNCTTYKNPQKPLYQACSPAQKWGTWQALYVCTYSREIFFACGFCNNTSYKNPHCLQLCIKTYTFALELIGFAIHLSEFICKKNGISVKLMGSVTINILKKKRFSNLKFAHMTCYFKRHPDPPKKKNNGVKQ